MHLIITAPNSATWNNRTLPCATGRNGFAAARDKTEGDGKTPIGRWQMREVFYRADKIKDIPTRLPVRAIEPNDGWCDAPTDKNYNRRVDLPYPASAENLWREDHLYDIVVVLAYNDDPPIAGKGSAIFLHVAPNGFAPTVGCVTLSREDLLAVLRDAGKDSAVVVNPGL